MNVPISVPAEALYLELGILNLEAILKARRINYLHNLVNQNPESMLFKFFISQWNHSVAGDWTNQARLDISYFGIQEDLKFIQSKSKYAFKKLVKVKVREYAFFSFLEMQDKHSKLKDLFYSDLKLQEYLNLNNLTATE